MYGHTEKKEPNLTGLYIRFISKGTLLIVKPNDDTFEVSRGNGDTLHIYQDKWNDEPMTKEEEENFKLIYKQQRSV